MIAILELAVYLAVLIWPFMFIEPVSQFRAAKIYLCDPFYAIFFAYVFYQVAARAVKGTLGGGSWRWFVLYLLVCLFQLFRGLLQYGHSAIGESRIYLLPVLFYFVLVLAASSDVAIIPVARRVFCVMLAMLPLNVVLYYFEVREPEVDGRFRFLWATEALTVSLSAIALIVYHSNSDSKVARVRSACGAAFLLAVVAMAQVRSVWVATVAVLLGLLVPRKTRPSVVLLGGAAVAGVIVCAMVLGGDLKEKLQDDFDKSSIFLRDFSEDDNASWRLRGWEQELESFWNSPLIGRGFGGYSWWYDGHEWQRVAVHNGFIMALSKSGLVGFLFLAVGVISWFRETWAWAKATGVSRRRGWLWVCQAGVVAHLIYALFYDFTPYFWLLIGAGTLVGYGVLGEMPSEAASPGTADPAQTAAEGTAGPSGVPEPSLDGPPAGGSR